MAIALCFWLNIYFGLILLLFIVGVLWWIMVKRKKRFDQVLVALAQELGFDVEKSTLKYFRVKGEYKGYPVAIGIQKNLDAMGRAGTLLTTLTGEAAWSTLDIRNFMSIKLVHNLNLSQGLLLAKGFETIATSPNETYYFFPDEFPPKEEIKKGLNQLIKGVAELKK